MRVGNEKSSKKEKHNEVESHVFFSYLRKIERDREKMKKSGEIRK